MNRSLNGATFHTIRALPLFLALALLSLATLFELSLAAGCLIPGTCFEPLGTCISNYSTSSTSFCSCRSGSYGDFCDIAAPSSCTYEILGGNASKSTTSISVSFISDNLVITVRTGLVRERNYTIIAIDDSAIQNPNCTYPGFHWTHRVSSCNDVYVGTLPWSDNIACGWVDGNSDAFFTRYAAQLLIEHHDFVSPFVNRTSATPVERIVQHIQPLTVNFPKNIGIAGDFVLSSPVRLLQQVLKVDTKNSTIEFATNLIWPYYLTNFSVISGPNISFTYLTKTLLDDCPIDGVSSCTQTFQMVILSQGACDINGVYELQWNIACRVDATATNQTCSYIPGDTMNGTITIVSGKTCATVYTTVPITGGLAVYDDAALSTYNPENLIGATIFYRAVCATGNVTVTGFTINTVKITSIGQPDILILLNGVPVEPGYSISQFSFGEQGLEFSDFSFVLNSGLFPTLPEGETRLYTTRIIADVDYTAALTKKREYFETQFGDLNTAPLAISSNFNVKRSTSSNGSPSQLTTAFALASTFLFSILFVLPSDS